MEAIGAGCIAALLTVFDLDRTFYIPSEVKDRVILRTWWWGFVLANGLLAIGLYGLVKDLGALKALSPWLRSLLVGTSYLALLRLKLTTFTYQGKEVPAGLELFYEAAREFVYKRINRIAKEASLNETISLADKRSLADLAEDVKLMIEQDALIKPEDKRLTRVWLHKTLDDAKATETEKRRYLAYYLLSGHRTD